MSNCNDPYNSVCRQDIPYPQVSPESVPSLITNLVTALYGAFYNPQTGQGFVTKSVVDGRVVWTSACDPNNSYEVPGVPRNNGEGLLCYIIRLFTLYDPTGFAKLVGPQTITLSTFSNGIISNCSFVNPTGLTKANVGLANVDNTSDINKPVSTLQAAYVAAQLSTFVPTRSNNLSGGVFGSVPYQTALNQTALLAPSVTAGYVLISNGPGAAPSWVQNTAISTSAQNLVGGLAGTIPYQDSPGTTLFTAVGTADYVLKSNGGSAPTWVQKAPQATASDTATTATNIANGLAGSIPYQSAAATTQMLAAGTGTQVLGGGTTPAWQNVNTTPTASTIAKRTNTGNIEAVGFIGSTFSGNAATATGLTAVAGLAAGTYGGSSQVPVITITSGGQITAASNLASPLVPTVSSFAEDKNTYANLFRGNGGVAFIDSENRVRFLGSGLGTGSWNATGLGTASEFLTFGKAQIISPEYVTAGEYAVKVYLQHRCMFILSNLGNLYGTGENGLGQIGLGFANGVTAFPRKVSIDTTTYGQVIDFAVSQGGNVADQVYCIAVTSDGSVFTWGFNSTGQLGNGTNAAIGTPTRITGIVNASNQIQGKVFDKCYAGGVPGYCFVIERTTKTVYASGYNGYGNLGLNNGNASVNWFNVLPTLAGAPTTADEIYTSGGTNAVVSATTHNRATSFIRLSGQIYSTGSDWSGETGRGTEGTDYASFGAIAGLTNIVDLAVSNGFGSATTGRGMSVAAVNNTGQFWVWGNNYEGQLGNNPTTTPANSAVPIAYTSLEYQVNGSNSTAISWPAGRYAQKVQFLGGPGSSGATTWGVRGFVLDINGQMWVSGKAGVSEFGDGYNVSSNQVIWRPVRQNGIVFVDFDVTTNIASSRMQVYAKDTIGNMWSWGQNVSYATGSSSSATETQTPQRVILF